jgi:hypothetical protein
MKRFYSLSVDRLEDRCVPTVITEVEVVAASQVLTADVSTDPTAGTVVVETTDDTIYVIDVYPVDPTEPTNPDVPPDVTPDPGTGGGDPLPPIDDPFWL